MLSTALGFAVGFLLGFFTGVFVGAGRRAEVVLVEARRVARDETRPMSRLELDAALHQADEDGAITRRKRACRSWRLSDIFRR